MDAMKTSENSRRSGQVLIFAAMAAAILMFAVLWMIDVHRIIFLKDRSQNAGDAAALAAARWQATSLNLLGELNIMHAAALAAGNADAADVITNTQLRICFTGPLTGVAAAQQGAKLNGIRVNDEYNELFREHADTVRNGYATTVGGTSALPEPWPNAWEEYAGMIDAIASDGVAAGIDNAAFYTDPSGGHVLLDLGFYEAVAGREWCWFYLNHPDLLKSYSGYEWWPPLPEPDYPSYNSAEFLSLWVHPETRELADIGSRDVIADEAERLSAAFPQDTDTNAMYTAETWFFYSSGKWGSWSAMKEPFPIEGKVKQEYDYEGADAAVRVESISHRFMSGRTTEDTLIWTAAAKPFGYIKADGAKVPPPSLSFIIPAFHDVRLIPMDASSAPAGGSFDLQWRRHCREHLDDYLENGPSALRTGCKYCMNIKTWEVPYFRESGSSWLVTNSWKCTIRPSGSGGSSGGTRRAH